jgi:hypothetical protein
LNSYAPIALFRRHPTALLWSLLRGSASNSVLTLSLGALAIQQAWARRRWFLAWERP